MLDKAAQRRHDFFRNLKSNFMVGLTIVATVIALIPLFFVLGYLVSKGAASVNWAFFTRMPTPVGQNGGGMANAIMGTFELVGIATLIGVPIGVGAGVYLAENRGSQFAQVIRFSADVMMGIPSIVIGIFVYAIFVKPFYGFHHHDSPGHAHRGRDDPAGAT
jgi:phosphate transport system permease protein